MLLILFGMALIHHGQTGEIVADQDDQYNSGTITCDSGDACIVICCGDNSCEGATINCPANFDCDIRCEGTESCKSVTINYPTATAAAGTLICTGTKSCRSLSFPEPNPDIPLSIICDGFQACDRAELLCPTDAECNIVCYGNQACQYSSLICPTNANCIFTCHGSESCQYMTTTGPTDGNFTQDCVGNSACYTTDLTCPTDGHCDIDCISGVYVCDDFQITWPETAGLGTLSCPEDGQDVVESGCAEVVFPDPDPNVQMVIECHGYFICSSTIINCPEHADCTVDCIGYGSCFKTTINCPTNGNCDIRCIGEKSCEEVKGITGPSNGDLSQECKGDKACIKGTLTCPEAGQCDITCGVGDHVCKEYDITWPETAGLGTLSFSEAFGEYEVSGVVFPEPNPNIPVLIDCWDAWMCQNAEIFCPQNADCTVRCGYNGCKGATIHCPEKGGCAVLCEEEDACDDTEIIWGPTTNCATLICKGGKSCNDNTTSVPGASSECELPLLQGTESPTTALPTTASPTTSPTTATPTTPSPTKDDASSD